MDRKDFKKYLNDRYFEFIDWYDIHAKRSFKAYNVFQWSLVILSALTPVLILIEDMSTRWVAVSVAVLVAIASTALKTFKYQDTWLRYRTSWHAMKREMYLYEAGIQEYKSVKDKEALFIQRVEALIDQEVTEFVTLQETKIEK